MSTSVIDFNSLIIFSLSESEVAFSSSKTNLPNLSSGGTVFKFAKCLLLFLLIGLLKYAPDVCINIWEKYEESKDIPILFFLSLLNPPC